MAVEALLTATLALIIKLSANQILQHLWQIWGVADELEKLRRPLLSILSVIGDAEERQLKDKAVKSWLTELKHVAYEAENILDEVNTLVLRQSSDIQNQLKKRVSDLFSLHNPILRRLVLGSKLRNVLKKIDGVMIEMHKFNLRLGNQLPQRNRPQTHSFIIEADVIGRDEDRENIVNMLTTNPLDDRMLVVCVVGMMGLGKTTLAQLVYGDSHVQKHFELQMWICASDDFDLEKISRRMIESATGKQCDLANMELLQQQLRTLVEAKRYLLVLDDVWNEDSHKWEELKSLLVCGDNSSRILVTTRKVKCSTVMDADMVYHPECLSQESSWVLFEKSALGRNAVKHPFMEKIGRSIVRRCGGLPFAIKALASLMRFKREEREWLSVMESEIWELESVEDGIIPALWLSYNDMPSHLKKCFALCAIFPKDYDIEKETLIQLWMANGFIQYQAETDVEIKGQEIFNELVWRSFLQDVKEVRNHASYSQTVITTCKMHDLMHKLAQLVMSDEYFPELGCVSLKTIPKGIRHLQVSADASSYLSDHRRSIRTILFRNQFSRVVEKLEFLRVLDLQLSKIDKFPAWIRNLRHLRYLDLSQTSIRKLPEEICMLVNLQTLKLNCCRQLTELPKSIVFMCNLRHLHINSCLELRSMPTGLSQLQNLRTITKYVVNSSTGSEIRELKQLNLGGRLALYNLHKVKNAGIAKEVNLDSKPNIISLALCWSASDYHSYYAEEPAENAEEVLEALKPHYGVKMLSIAHYPGVKFPLWLREVQEFRNLIEVRLEDCRGCLQLPPLDQLPSLEVLHLRQMEGIRHISNSLKSSAVQAFPALKNLVLNNMRNLEGWFADEEKEAVQSFFPSLILMKIDECPKLTTMPYIPTLEDLLIVRASNETDTSHFSRERVFFKQLKSLNILTIERCEELALMLGDEEETRAMSKSLQKITICYCNQFVSTPEIWNLPFVKHLEIYGCSTLVSWPLIILQGLNSLKTLCISLCKNFRGLSSELHSSVADGGLPCLEVLDLLYCDALLELPECLTLRLNVISCPCITSLNAAPKCLTELHVQDCWELVSLSKDMGHLGSLKHIELNHCPKLRTFPEGMQALTSLQLLHVEKCNSLEAFPVGLQQLLRQLKRLTIRDCAELERRCKPGGEYSHLVSEIPSTDIGSTAPKTNTGK